MINLTPMQREILRAIQLHGGITPEITDRNGWTRKGQPTTEFFQLIREHKLVAPRVLTSIPLRIVWQMRDQANHKETLAKIEREACRLNFREWAVGGFRLITRKGIR